MTVLIALCVMGGGASAAVGVLVTLMKCEGGVGGAVDLLRLPNCALPAVLLLSEVGASSAATLVLYDPSEARDVVLGLVVLLVLVGYMVLQAVRVVGGGYRVQRVHATRQSILQYVLDPTHEVEATSERWLRRGHVATLHVDPYPSYYIAPNCNASEYALAAFRPSHFSTHLYLCVPCFGIGLCA